MTSSFGLNVSETFPETAGKHNRSKSPGLAVEKSSRKINKQVRKITKDVTATATHKAGTVEAKIIQTDVANFRSLVQELTGSYPSAPPILQASPSPPPPATLSRMQIPTLSPASPLPTILSSIEPCSANAASPSDPPGKSGNKRLRNLAPPPIRPTPVHHQMFRFMPPRPPGPAPSASLQNGSANPGGHSANSSLSGVSPYSRGGSMNSSPLSVPGSPFSVFSPHILSPLTNLSPHAFPWGALPESPASLAMKEMAMLVTGTGMQQQTNEIGALSPRLPAACGFGSSGIFSPQQNGPFSGGFPPMHVSASPRFFPSFPIPSDFSSSFQDAHAAAASIDTHMS